ncbi:hypothetical protein [Rubrivirga sp. IMCC45206]|uniref:hypothetical protein n=1 Tax=Rubrivirga sp. IMCC45206 TaxID=3391614 RepID=UPI00398FDE48
MSDPSAQSTPAAGAAPSREPVQVRCDEKDGIPYVYVVRTHVGSANPAKLMFVVTQNCPIALVDVVASENCTVSNVRPLQNGRRMEADIAFTLATGGKATVVFELWFVGPNGTRCQAYGGEPDGMATGCGFQPISGRVPPSPPPKVDFP